MKNNGRRIELVTKTDDVSIVIGGGAGKIRTGSGLSTTTFIDLTLESCSIAITVA